MQKPFFAVILALVFTCPLAAQGTISEGSKVRFTTSSNQKLVGVVRSKTADSLTIYTEPAGVPATIALSAISGLEISRGKSGMQGAKKGLLWGAGVGAALVGGVYLAAGGCNEGYTSCDDAENVGTAIGTGALGGAVWGLVIGSLVGSEKWDNATIRPVGASGPNGLMLGFAIRR